MTTTRDSRIDANAWSLVTGASSGIGAEIARALAARGSRLLLVARRTDRLDALAATLRDAHGVDVRTLALDLVAAGAGQRLFDYTQSNQLPIDILVNNAGLGQYGAFATSALERQLAMIRLNCEAVVELSHRFVEPMIARGRGRILIVSTTTLAPAPYVTTYAATKGFDLLLAEGLAEEVARHGVTVSALCPGPTKTELMHDAQVDAPSAAAEQKLQSAAEVAELAVDGLLRGKRYIRPSFMASVMANAPRFLPRATVSGMTEAYYRPGRKQ